MNNLAEKIKIIKKLSERYNHKLDWDIINNTTEETLDGVIQLFDKVYVKSNTEI